MRLVDKSNCLQLQGSRVPEAALEACSDFTKNVGHRLIPGVGFDSTLHCFWSRENKNKLIFEPDPSPGKPKNNHIVAASPAKTLHANLLDHGSGRRPQAKLAKGSLQPLPRRIELCLSKVSRCGNLPERSGRDKAEIS